MSEVSTPVTERHFQYIVEHTRGDDEFLRRLKEEARAAGLPAIWISEDEASFLQVLLRAAKVREVIEVGTLAGTSAIVMARALVEGGRVRTIEVNARHADFAERWIAKSDVAGRIQVLRGSGKDLLPTIGTDSADAAFLDADKTNYPFYLKESLRIVRKGGLVMADNAFAFGQLFDEHPTDREVSAMRAFNKLMAKEKKLQSIIVPVGDGCWVGVKL